MDGCGAYFAAETQHAGQAVWEEQIKTSDDYMKTRKLILTLMVTVIIL